jgi:hypothetical protein
MSKIRNRRDFMVGGAAGLAGTAVVTRTSDAGDSNATTARRAAWDHIARMHPETTTGFSHTGWPMDADPNLPQLTAGGKVVVADIKGPAVITMLHTTQIRYYGLLPAGPKEVAATRERAIERAAERRLAMEKGREQPPRLMDPAFVPDEVKARGIIVEVYYDGVDVPAVRVPLADFFADGCNGRAVNFSTPFVEKAPDSYNSFIPMPFEKSAKVVLVNETEYDLGFYTYVEFEDLPGWDPALGYFHATWDRRSWQLDDRSDQLLFSVKGQGHLLGRNVSITTDEPIFSNFAYVMEGNNEFYIDGEEKPRINYLGTEDAFGFSWGFPAIHTGDFHGINFKQKADPAMVSFYRFHGNQPVRFREGMDLRVNHSTEWAIQNIMLDGVLPYLAADGRLWVDYALTHYWYQDQVGFEHASMPSLDDRLRTVLRENPK